MKFNTKALLSTVTAASIVLTLAATASAAKPKNTPSNGRSHRKATGSVGYTANGLQRWGDFNAHELSNSIWDLTGIYDLAFHCTSVCSGTYNHRMAVNKFNPETGEFSGTGYYLASSFYTWTVEGTLSSNAVEYSITYTGANEGYEMDIKGEINSLRTMSGTATSSSGQTFDWETTTGLVSANTNGKGKYHYSDASGSWYDFDVKYVSFSDSESFYAGPVTDASNPNWLSNWASFSVKDGGTPGRNGDSIWGIFTDESTAIYLTAGQTHPGTKYSITSGNLVVH